ncbi:MAG TPA: YecA family protein [Candidatus Tenderia electrophaga]|uniref:YecA family protein n=1 Tax=Candidatus Tenderia electrophaga TaxID=1748243 RepID=A0A832J4L2_9GAMM|nr:YecA family protein [Candidatus Tenderia electrophaga]
MVNGYGVLVLNDCILIEEFCVIMPPPAYDDLDSLLSSYGGAFAASECHGILCAMASCQPQLDGETWARRMLSGEMEAVLDGTASGGVDAADKEALKALFDDAVKQLADPGLGFKLLLPDDDTSLDTRTEALAGWCEGFLYGLALGGIKEFNMFSEPVQEFAQDLAEIAQLSHEEGDDTETGESAFFDISEYVRMGVLMVRDELSRLDGPSGAATGAPDSVVLH